MGTKSVWMPIAAGLSFAVPLATVIGFWDAWWSHLIFVAWTIGAGALVVRHERAKARIKAERALVDSRKDAILTLSHHRHDWMNELQLVYGYLRLQKADKAIGVVDRIRERMSHDSKVSQLGNTELVTYLLSFRAMCDTMRLDIEVEDGLQLEKLFPGSDHLTEAIIGLVDAFRWRAVRPMGNPNALRLTFERTEQNLVIRLIYEGELAALGSLKDEAASLIDGLGKLTTEEGAEGDDGLAEMVVCIPLTA
jgi:stage 0 sporulation protein B (sporulation initiation phosphotransferase)